MDHEDLINEKVYQGLTRMRSLVNPSFKKVEAVYLTGCVCLRTRITLLSQISSYRTRRHDTRMREPILLPPRLQVRHYYHGKFGGGGRDLLLEVLEAECPHLNRCRTG